MIEHRWVVCPVTTNFSLLSEEQRQTLFVQQVKALSSSSGRPLACVREHCSIVWTEPLHLSPSLPWVFSKKLAHFYHLSLCLTSDNTHTFYTNPPLFFFFWSWGLFIISKGSVPTHPHTHLMTVRMLLFNPLIIQQGHRGNTWGWRTAASRKYTQLNSSVWNGMKYTGSCPTRVEPACDKLLRQGVNSHTLALSLSVGKSASLILIMARKYINKLYIKELQFW